MRFTLGGLVTLSAACRPMVASAVADMYGKEFACPEKQVTVETISQHRYRATGCDAWATYQCVDGWDNCFPTESSRSASSPSAAPQPQASAAAPHSAEAAVAAAKSESDAGVKAKPDGVVAIDLVLENRTMFKLKGLPSKDERVELMLSHMEVDPEHRGCTFELTLNGAPVAVPKARYVRSSRFWSLATSLPIAAVRDVGAASQVGLRGCGLGWSLAPGHIEHVRAFVQRFENELATAAEQRKTKALDSTPPGDGWPAWKVESAMPAASLKGKTLDAQALFQLLSPSVFRVEALLASGTAEGSAVAVSTSELLTNCHVVDGARKVIVKQGKREYVARLARSHAKTDRCVLALPDPILKPVVGVRAYGDLKVGEPVYTLGTPAGLELTISDGLLSGLREEEGRRFVQTTAPISPGSSGGGLFDAHGNLIGITTASLLDRERKTQALNFAIAADSFWQP